MTNLLSLKTQRPPASSTMPAVPAREPELTTESTVMGQLVATLNRFAASEAPVLIEGETGTGKELVARAIHACSPVASGPLVDINCAALPDHLAESELFGYEKGAFSGADGSKPGLFELADGGTLFFDEIGELAPQLQSKLLRVLDRMEYFRLGGTRQVRVRARVLAATNRKLAAEVVRGHFRADLYHRLNTLRIELPPLRERLADIVPLATGFLAQVAPGKRFDSRTFSLLERHTWPGNVRELRNVVRRAAALASGEFIVPGDLPDELRAGQDGQVPFSPGIRNSSIPNMEQPDVAQGDWRLDNLERRWIQAALRHTGGHQQRAASLLGLSRRTLSRKLHEWGLAPASASGR